MKSMGTAQKDRPFKNIPKKPSMQSEKQSDFGDKRSTPKVYYSGIPGPPKYSKLIQKNF
jgi:hypothetical protein